MSVYQTKVLVLLASYNGQRHIEEQVKSVLKQVGVDVTVLVSDDCSNDNTPYILKSLLSQNKNIVLLKDICSGGAAKNFFRLLQDADFSNFDYVALADQDDIWQSDKLSHAVQKIQENAVDAYSSNVTAFWPDGKQRLIDKAQSQQQWDYMFESAGPGCTFVLTKKLALEIQSFLIANELQCKDVALHDWFIYAFARSHGFKWFIDHESHMFYRQHAENVVGANEGVNAKLDRWRKLREGWFIKQALLNAEIFGYVDAWPVGKLRSYKLLDRLTLIVSVRKLRRRLRDRVALALFLLLPLKK